MKIVSIDYLELFEPDQQKLRTLGDTVIYDSIPQTEAEILRRITDHDAELIITSTTPLSKTVIQNAPSLKYIVVPGVGCDGIDLEAATAATIKVLNCPTHNSLAVAEYTIGLMFAIARHIPQAHQSLQQSHWQPRHFQGSELHGKQLGIIGYGSIGQKVAEMAIALGMTVRTATSRTSAAELDSLVATADWLTLNLPLTPQSHHLIDARRLSLMKPTAYLINTARGGIVDTPALLQALQEKRIAGAALDVFEAEPTTDDPSAEILELSRLGSVITTAHIAYNTHEAIQRLGAELLQNIQSCLQGNPINSVN